MQILLQNYYGILPLEYAHLYMYVQMPRMHENRSQITACLLPDQVFKIGLWQTTDWMLRNSEICSSAVPCRVSSSALE